MYPPHYLYRERTNDYPVSNIRKIAGFEVTTLVRNPEKAGKGLPPSVKRVPA